MLKWLQHSSQIHPKNVHDYITDDPLATLNFKDEDDHLPKRQHKEIYSVSRTNPLYFEEKKQSSGVQVASNATATSSSGYSSNRATLPQMNNNELSNNAGGVDSMLEVDSLEADLILDEDSYEDSIQPIPAPVWPDSNRRGSSQGVLDRDINFLADISLRDSENTLEVARNGHYVEAVHFGSSVRRSSLIMGSTVLRSRGGVPKMLEPHLAPIGEVHDDSRIQDSIVTDALLQMTSFSNGEDLLSTSETEKSDSEQQDPRKEDMDRVIAELTQAVMKSRNVTTLTRAMKTNGDLSMSKRGGKLRSSLKSLKSTRGLEAMRELWLQTGMKTNGRKLLVNSLSEEEEGTLADKSSRTYQRRNRSQQPYCGPCRVHAKLSSSSSGSETSPPYRKVFRRKRSLTSSTELYAEVYKTSSGESTQSPIYTSTLGISRNQEITTSTSCSTSVADSSSPTISQKQKGNRRKVQFSQEVHDNEMTSHKLIYENLPMTSPPRKNNSVVIDIAKLNADQGFGFNKYLTSDSSYHSDYGKQIFQSPYFDYRRTHSRAGSVYSGSELRGASSTISKNNVAAKNPSLYGSDDHHQILRGSGDSDVFWKGFAIFLVVTFILAIITSLTVYFVYKSYWL